MYLCERHPKTISLPTSPDFLRSAAERMAWMDSSFASPMNQSAGVDEKHIDRTNLILRHNPPRVLDLRKKMFRVNRVLGTA